MVGDFLSRNVACIGGDQEVLHLAEYLLCLSALSYDFLQHLPQAVAAAAVVLSHEALGQHRQHRPYPNWLQQLLQCAGVNITGDLIPCIQKLADLHASFCTKTSCLPGRSGKGKLCAPPHFDVAGVPLAQSWWVCQSLHPVS